MKKRTPAVRSIINAPPTGLNPHRVAPYWQGERAEAIVTLRAQLYATEREQAVARRQGKRTATAGKGRKRDPRTTV